MKGLRGLGTLIAASMLPALGCGGQGAVQSGGPAFSLPGATVDDRARCEFRGRADREVSESAGPGASVPNVRRVFQVVGTGEERHKVLICREIDTNLDGLKDVVRVYNEKGESLYEQADTDYDGLIDTWLTFAGGRVIKEARDTMRQGKPDTWKHYVNGQLSRIQRDTNGDGQPDRWELYSDGKLERIGVDLDYDGHVDRWDRDELQKAADEAAHRKASADNDASKGSEAK